MNARQIAPLYPRLENFRALTAEFDRKQKFQNAFLRDHLAIT